MIQSLFSFLFIRCVATAVSDDVVFSPLLVPVGLRVSVAVAQTQRQFVQDDEPYNLDIVRRNSTNGLFEVESSEPCTIAGGGSLNCPVQASATGQYLAVLRSALPAQWLVTINCFELPVATSVLPIVLAMKGREKLRIAVASPVTHYGRIVLKFVEPVSGRLAACELTLDMPNGTLLHGRSPSFSSFQESDRLHVWLSLNGVHFYDTGIVVGLVKVAKLKVGFLYVGSPDDFGWNFQHNEARLMLEEHMSEQIETRYVNDVSEWGPNQCDFCVQEPGWNTSVNGGVGGWEDEPADFFGTHESAMIMRRWIEEDGVDMIIGTSFYFHWDMNHMARRYSNTSFVHASGWLTRMNMAVTFPRVEQARYLSGIAVGWYIKVNNLPKKVGFLSSYQLGETVRAVNAFKLGLEVVDPEIEVYLTWVFSWNDARKERVGAERLMQYYGVEALAQHTDSPETQHVAHEHGKVGVGYNSDMLRIVGDSVLTSPILAWGQDYMTFVQRVLDGEPMDYANFWHGAESGAWRLSDFSSRVPIEARIQIVEEHAKLTAGQDTIFCRPNLTDNKGRIRNGPTNPAVKPLPWEQEHLIPGTTCLAPDVINSCCQEYNGFSCDERWLLKGVIDTCDPSPTHPQGLALVEGQCFVGPMTIPDACPDGSFLKITGCTLVRRGHFSQDEKEVPCVAGYYSDAAGASACKPCVSGSAAGTEGSVRCGLCPSGQYSDTWGAKACRRCEPGRFSRQIGATACDICDFGLYATQSGQSECASCSPGRVTVRMATSSSDACVCSEGTYLSSDHGSAIPRQGRTCLPCPEGMSCATGADAGNFPAPGSSVAAGPYPMVMAGYMTLVEEPVSVYRCLHGHACPGGASGTCADLLDATTVACGRCVKGAYASRGDCLACTGNEAGAVVVVVILCVVGVIVFTLAVNNDRIKQPRSLMTIGLLLAQMLTGIQTMGVFKQLKITWFSPMSEILEFMQILTFELSVLRLSCVLGDNTAFNYGVRQMIAPASFLLLVAVVLMKRRFDCRVDVAAQISNAFGNVVSILFISIVLSCSMPFWCSLLHPSGLSSILDDPSVLCWVSSMHTTMVVIGLIAFCLIPLPFLVAACYFTRMLPFYFSDHSMLSSRKLNGLRFMYVRFAPSKYWFSLVLLLRNLVLAFIPSLVHEACLQIFFVFALLLFVTSIQQINKPWSANVANLADSILSNLLMLLLLSGFAATEAVTDQKPLRIFALCVFASLFVVMLVFVVQAVFLYLNPYPWYDYFLCHHKAAAAAQARLLKLILQHNKHKEVFIDSDDLFDLSILFDIVKTRVYTLAVYLTDSTLARGWCVGEIVSACSAKVTMVAMVTSSFQEPPSDLQLLRDYVDPSGCDFSSLGIDMTMIAEGIRTLLSESTPRVAITDIEGVGRGKFMLIAEALLVAPKTSKALRISRCLQIKSIFKSVGQANMGDTVSCQPTVRPSADNIMICSDVHDDETTAAVGILVSKVQEQILSKVPEGLFCLCDSPLSEAEMLQAFAQARASIFVLSCGTLQSQLQVVGIAQVMHICVCETQRVKDPAISVILNSVRERSTRRNSSQRNGLQVIPIALPSFVFPSETFYNEGLKQFRPEGQQHFADLLRGFFKLIALRFQTHGSDAVLETQAREVANRIPQKSVARLAENLLKEYSVFLDTSTTPGVTIPTEASGLNLSEDLECPEPVLVELAEDVVTLM